MRVIPRVVFHFMRTKLCGFALILFVFCPAAWSMDVAGVALPDEFDAGGMTLTLQGAGVRERFFIDLYVAGLYLERRNDDSAAVVEADAAMAIRLAIVSSRVTQERMEDAIRDGFARVLDGDIAALAADIDRFVDVFKPEVNQGDIYEFVYVPGKGTQVISNAKDTLNVAGIAFKRALFGIWLSDDPVQKSLKNALLGKT